MKKMILAMAVCCVCLGVSHGKDNKSKDPPPPKDEKTCTKTESGWVLDLGVIRGGNRTTIETCESGPKDPPAKDPKDPKKPN